jgi:hypothetical protein
VMWIRSIARLNSFTAVIVYATNIHLLLQANPESNEAEHLLGSLHSLIRIPPPSDQATSRYDFYHKSLFDFFEDPSRCRTLYVDDSEIRAFIWNAFVRACMSEFDSASLFPFQRMNLTIWNFNTKGAAITGFSSRKPSSIFWRDYQTL